MSELCRRCRQDKALINDTYCLACGSWEALGRELQSPWGTGAFRALAAEVLVSGTRQVRALRNLSAAYESAAGPPPGKLEPQPAPAVETDERPAPKKAKSPQAACAPSSSLAYRRSQARGARG